MALSALALLVLAPSAFAQTSSDARLADLMPLVNKYDAPAAPHATPSVRAQVMAPVARVNLSHSAPPVATRVTQRALAKAGPPQTPHSVIDLTKIEGRLTPIKLAGSEPVSAAPPRKAEVVAAVPKGKLLPNTSLNPSVADRRRSHAVNKDADGNLLADDGATDDQDASSDQATSASALPAGGNASLPGVPSLLPNARLSVPDALSAGLAAPALSVGVQTQPVIPPPGPAPTGLIVGNGGVVGTVTQLLGPTVNSLFGSPDGYVANGTLRVNNANFSQGYATLNALGLPLLNLTPVGSLLTSTTGTLVGGTGIDSHLTLVGGVSSGNYITNINNGNPGGVLGLLLPGQAPAWASTCLNVLGLVTESCWGLNAAQDYQVLVGDGASANGSKEVVIGTGASHTLPAVNANTAFPGAGTNDPNNPSGVPTADYEARLGHSVVVGDDASGTANAQTILGAEATSSAANSVALGYKSVANRGALLSYVAFGLAAAQTSSGEVSVGTVGGERQITNVAAGSAPTDAVNVAQLQGVAVDVGNAVEYDDIGKATVTLAGPPATNGGTVGGTTITNLHQGVLSAASTDAVNGAQLFATNNSISNIYVAGTKYFRANSTGTASVALGADAIAAGVNSQGIGVNSIAIGNGSLASGLQATAVGSGAEATAAGGVALGQNSMASTAAGVAGYVPLGSSAANLAAINATSSTLGALSVADAASKQYRQINGVAAGTAASDAVNVAQLQAVDSQVSALGDSAVRYDANPDGSTNFSKVTLFGAPSTDGGATGGTMISNLHQGALSTTSTDAVNGAQLFATNSLITNIYDTGTKYFQANSTGAGSVATGIDSVAVGMGASAINNSDVALGSGSITEAAHAGTTAFFGGIAAGTAGSVISIGAAGSERQLQNVAPGVLGATSTDAVNGSQLFSVAAGVNALGNSVATSLGGGSSFDLSSGAVTANLSYGGTSYGSVQDVINALTGGGPGQGIKYFHVNSTLADGAAAGADSVAIGPLSSAGGADSLALGNGANASMANSVALGAGSVTVVGARSNYAAYGLTALQTSLGEINVGDRQITGVAAGSAANDAVNVAQLQAVNNQVHSMDQLAVKYDADTAGNATNTITLIGDRTGAPVRITQLAVGAETSTSTDAVNGSQIWHWTQDVSNIYSNYSLYNDIQNLPAGGGGSTKYFHANSTLGDSTASGSNSVAIGPAASASGSGSVALGNGAEATADNAVAIGTGSVADRANTVSVGSATNARQITNVAAGSAATDAVNVGQLSATVTASEKGTVRYDTHTDGSVDYNNLTLGNGSGTTSIHDVAAGVADTDAVNKAQLDSGMQQVANWASAYTDQRIQQLGNRANAGVAAAMAMGGLPQAYEPGKSMAAVAGGSFRGESSLAIGVSTISEGGRWVYKLTGSTDSRGDAGFSVGAGMQW